MFGHCIIYCWHLPSQLGVRIPDPRTEGGWIAGGLGWMLGGLGWIHIEDLNSRPGKFSTLGLESKKGCVECCPKNPGPAWCPVKRSLFLKGAGKTILYEVLGPNREQHCWWRVTVEFWPRRFCGKDYILISNQPDSLCAGMECWVCMGFMEAKFPFGGDISRGSFKKMAPNMVYRLYRLSYKVGPHEL